MKIEAAQRLLASQFRYGLVNRPPAIGAVPKGYVHYEPSNEGIDSIRHGILTYDRELTPQEVKGFELVPLSGEDGKPLAHVKFPQAVLNKAREAIDTINYILEEGDSPDHAEPKAEAEAVLNIFRKYAHGKGLDAERALKELGYK